MLLIVLVRSLRRIEEWEERMVEREELVEEVSGILIGQLHTAKLVSDLGHVIRAPSLEMEERGDSLFGAHEGGIAGVSVWCALRQRRL